MIVTFDSNMSCITDKLEATMYPVPIRRWCRDACACINIKDSVSSKTYSLFYDSPISICDSIDGMPIKNKFSMFNIIYIDKRVRNERYKRIVKHLKELDRAVVITTESSDGVDTDSTPGIYNYILNNADTCSNDLVLRFIVTFINSFVRLKRFLHPDDMVRDLRDEPIANEPVQTTNACNLYNFSRDHLKQKSKASGTRYDSLVYY